MAARKEWIVETLFEDLGLRMGYEVTEMLHEERTPHQHMQLFMHPRLRKTLMLDGVIQTSEADSFIYREMMAHVPLFAHGRAKRVLIIGGGDCDIAGAVLQHRCVQQLVQVEIDPTVVKFARQYFPEITEPVFADARFRSLIGDGMDYVETTENRFDVIIVDSSNPCGPNEVLFSSQFYAACKRCFSSQYGILVTMNGVPFLEEELLFNSISHFNELFRFNGCYITTVPTYVGGPLAIGWASDHLDLNETPLEILEGRYQVEDFATRCWTPRVHQAAFALPPYIEGILRRAMS